MAIFRPTGTLGNLTLLTPEMLRTLGVRGIVLDVDNTMAAHSDQTPFPGVVEWTERMRAAGVQLVVVSNNFEKRVAPFAEKFGLPHISFAMKPSPFGYLRAKKKMGLCARECAAVGDQIFTDIVGANLCGMRSVLLEPVTRDPALTVRFKRFLERFFRPRYASLELTGNPPENHTNDLERKGERK